MENRRVYYIGLAFCGVFALSPVFIAQYARATEIEKWLIMPGPVVASHADVEAECDECHAPMSDVPQGNLCMTCHTEVRADVRGEAGFHGRLPESQRLECATCHTDHEGRDMSIVELDEAAFDHTLTDFALHGAHLGVDCGDCHAAGDAHRQAESECIDCHRSDDVHDGKLGEECAACHNSNAWTEAKFDHSTTGFALTGGHMTATCAACHKSDDFADVGRTCIACHQADDVHEGKNGTQCADCHSSSSWENSTFNHHAMTGFALLGGHKSLSCQSCHQADDFTDLGNASCGSCHRKNDVHKGRFGTDCGACHNTFNWDSSYFDHKTRTGFALPDGHSGLACTVCHTGNLDDELPRACGGCHIGDDAHQGQLGDECEACHVPTSWTATVWFDHDITPFPLIGAHAEVACQSCHATAAFHDADGACVTCHGDEDPHRGSLGEQCDSCHNPADWQAWQFDHDTQTTFPLSGAHTDVSCNACHLDNGGRGDAIRPDCNSCHRRDDPHLGRFGNNCESCHTTSSFSQIEGM